MNQRDLVRRLRAAKWVSIRPHPPAPPVLPTREQELARLREHLAIISASDRTIRSWDCVTSETKQQMLSENAMTRMGVEARIKQLAGDKTTSRAPRGFHNVGGS